MSPDFRLLMLHVPIPRARPTLLCLEVDRLCESHQNSKAVILDDLPSLNAVPSGRLYPPSVHTNGDLGQRSWNIYIGAFLHSNGY